MQGNDHFLIETRKSLTPVALSLGGNIGDVRSNFKYVELKLAESEFREIRISSLYKTKPLGCKPGTPDFINAALTAQSPLSVQGLFIVCKKLESECGRDRNERAKNAPRPLDLDILIYGELVFSDGIINVPHKEASKRLFVLIPLNEIAPLWKFHDSGKTVAETISPFRKMPEYNSIIRNKLKTA